MSNFKFYEKNATVGMSSNMLSEAYKLRDRKFAIEENLDTEGIVIKAGNLILDKIASNLGGKVCVVIPKDKTKNILLDGQECPICGINPELLKVFLRSATFYPEECSEECLQKYENSYAFDVFLRRPEE